MTHESKPEAIELTSISTEPGEEGIVFAQPAHGIMIGQERYPGDEGMLTPDEIKDLAHAMTADDNEDLPMVGQIAFELIMSNYYQESGDTLLVPADQIDDAIHQVAIMAVHWAFKLKEKYLPEALEGRWPENSWPPLLFQQALEAARARKE